MTSKHIINTSKASASSTTPTNKISRLLHHPLLIPALPPTPKTNPIFIKKILLAKKIPKIKIFNFPIFPKIQSFKFKYLELTLNKTGLKPKNFLKYFQIS
jgi:hypothetical protein